MRGKSLPFTGWSDDDAETYFSQVGIGLVVLEPGEPMTTYHWEADQEDLLLLSGEALHVDADCHGGAYTVDEAALRHGAGLKEETSDGTLACAEFPESKPTRYRDGWLP